MKDDNKWNERDGYSIFSSSEFLDVARSYFSPLTALSNEFRRSINAPMCRNSGSANTPNDGSKN